MKEELLHLGTDSSPWAQNDNRVEASSGHHVFVSYPHVEIEVFLQMLASWVNEHN